MKIRTGRLEKEMTDEAAVYTSSLEFDRFIFDADIQCNYAHTSMLKAQGIIDEEIADKILEALDKLSDEGFDALEFDHSVEDVHMAVENYVTKLVGPEAGFMHTAKSRNDQVATDIRLLLRDRITEIQIGILEFIEGILELAKEHKETVMIGYTHLQHAQPVTLAHHLMAHAQALKRDYQRLDDTYKRVNLNPLGSAAMATTSFPIDRELTTQLLGFDDYLENSMDGVSSRDHIAETVFDLSALCTTLSKICEELVLWSTYEFGIVSMADEYSSTSSIMPQKKNPDVAEVARSKCAIVNGELVTILTILKAIPYTYNRDLQEITPHLWNACDVAYDTLKIVNHMLLTVTFNTKRCLEFIQFPHAQQLIEEAVARLLPLLFQLSLYSVFCLFHNSFNSFNSLFYCSILPSLQSKQYSASSSPCIGSIFPRCPVPFTMRRMGGSPLLSTAALPKHNATGDFPRSAPARPCPASSPPSRRCGGSASCWSD